MENDTLPEWLKEHAKQFEITPSEGSFAVMMRKREQQRKQRKLWGWMSFTAAATITMGVGLWLFSNQQESVRTSLQTLQQHTHQPQIRRQTTEAQDQYSSDAIPEKTDAVHSDEIPRQQPVGKRSTGQINMSARQQGASREPVSDIAQTPMLKIDESGVNTNPIEHTQLISNVSAAIQANQADSIIVAHPQDSLVLQVLADSLIQSSVDSSSQQVSLVPKADKQSYWSIAGVFTPQLMNSVYNVNSDATLSWMQKYLRNREQNDKAQYSFNAGIRVEKTFNKHWSVSTGVLYSMVKFEEIKLVNAVVIDTAVVENLAQAAKTSRVVEVTQNRFDISFSSLEVPLQAAYRLQYQKMYYQVTAGMSYAYLFRTTSLVFDQQDSLNVQETNDAGNSRLNQHSLLLLGGINVGYEFSKRWSCYAGPVYRYSLNSLYSKDYIIRQQPYYLGVELGVKYSFR